MQLTPDIRIVDLGLYIKERYLVICDTQLGYDEVLNRQGVMLPRQQFSTLIKRIRSMMKDINPDCVIINGDLKHDFGKVSRTEWRYASRLIDELGNVVLVRGNHDKMLDPIAEKKGLRIVDHYSIGDIYITHGHKLPDDKDFKSSDTVIIGHEHPAVSLREGGRVERFKCFLKGSYKKKTLIVQPSMNLLTEGTDILKEKLMSPFLKRIGGFEVFVVADEILYFGNVRSLKALSYH